MRSSFARKPTSTEDLALMRRMDERYLGFPFAKSRMLSDLRKNERLASVASEFAV